MELLSKLVGKLGGKLEKPLAKLAYDAALQSPTGKKFQRWIPLTSSAVFAGLILAKMFGWAGADHLLDVLRSIGVEPGISEVELGAGLGVVFGLVMKGVSLYLKARGELVPPNSAPIIQTEEQWKHFISTYQTLEKNTSWEEARRLALVAVMERHAPVPVDDKFREIARVEAKAAATKKVEGK